MEDIKKKKIDYRHFVAVGIVLILCSFVGLFFSDFLGRLIESFRDFGVSVYYYFCQMFQKSCDIDVTVKNLPKIPFFNFGNVEGGAPSVDLPPVIIPDNKFSFVEKWNLYLSTFGSLENFSAYGNFFVKILLVFSQILLTVIPLFLLLAFFVKSHLNKENNDYNKNSKCLTFYLFFSKYTVVKIKNFFISMKDFFANYRFYVYIYFFLFLLSFNLITILVEFLAYYFYFISSFDFSSIYRQIYKLFIDLAVMGKIPWFFWLIALLYCLFKFRVKMGFLELNHNELKNRGFINLLPVVTIMVGPMGCSKTTLNTDMTISQNIMFRDKTIELLQKNAMKFSNFPFINFENEIKRAMKYGEVFNLASCGIFVNKKKKRFEKMPIVSKIFDYDFEKFGLFYDDKLEKLYLFDLLITYSKLYFMYVLNSSFIQSNFAIRSDSVLIDNGNLPLWDSSIFERTTDNQFPWYSHILDFDTVRLGKKIVATSRNSFEFGVVSLTEIGKERQNSKELQGVKKRDDETNQLNDMFNSWLKMCRHSATVDNYPFIKVFMDEQRPESLGADVRDLCTIIHIGKNKQKNVLFFWWVDELICQTIIDKFQRFYLNYRHNRSDNNLLMYFLKFVVSKIFNYYFRNSNLFGYKNVDLALESGVMDGALENKNYYLSSKKIYSKRFSTDCYSDYFAERILKNDTSLAGIREYLDVKANKDELEFQNSYFIRDLTKWQKRED